MADITYPISVSEMRERYLKLYSGAVNDVLRFEYKMHAALPSSYAPLKPEMKICGQAFTIKGAPDITTDGEFEARAKMLEDLHADIVGKYGNCRGGVVSGAAAVCLRRVGKFSVGVDLQAARFMIGGDEDCRFPIRCIFVQISDGIE